MIYVCDICLNSESVSLVTLVGYERLLALKLIKNKRKYALQTPLKTCQLCYNKLIFFVHNLYYRIKLKLIKTRKNTLKMHYPNYPPIKDSEAVRNQYFDLKLPDNSRTEEYLLPHQDQSRTEMNQPEGTCVDDYNCQCENCQNKYGDLPVLLQGIEQKTFNEKTDSQPSTSSQSSSSKRILTCDYCKKTFTHKGDFNKHLRKHTKEKPFSCPICNRKFGHTSNLLRHQRLHSGEKPFACDNCDKRFSRKDKLDCHKRSRTCQEASTSHNYD